MREERGQLGGNQVIAEAVDLWGSISGNVTVLDGGKVYVRGAIYGHLNVESGGRVHVYGNLQGSLTVEKGAKVIVSGVVGGDAVNNGGRMFIDGMGKVLGRVRRNGGETQVDDHAKVHEADR